MTWRRVPPASSPLSLAALAAATRGLLGPAAGARSRIEALLLAHFGAAGVLLTDSGTGALDLALRVCRARTGLAPVALPAYACFDLATAADGAGAGVLLYDLDPETLAPDAASLGRVLESGARTIVIVHLFGIPVDPAPLRAAADRYGALLVEDIAQAAGATLNGRPLGSAGDLAVMSFGRGKGITAGRGGALLAPRAGGGLLEAARGLAGPARRGAAELPKLAAQWLLGRPSLYALPAALPFLRLGETIYHPSGPVRGMSAVAAAALSRTWLLAAGEAAARRRNAARLLAAAGGGLAPVRAPAAAEPGFLRLPFDASEAMRAAAALPAARRLGVMPGYPVALCDLPGFGARVGNGGERFEGARRLARSLVTVPTHGLLSRRDLAAIESWMAGR